MAGTSLMAVKLFDDYYLIQRVLIVPMIVTGLQILSSNSFVQSVTLIFKFN